MIKLIHVSAEIGSASLFRNANLVLQSRRYGLVGPNGAGKSTLAKIIAGEASNLQISGEIQRTGSVTYLQQQQTPPRATVAEFTADFWSSTAAANSHLSTWISDLDPEQSVQSLSGGEWMRIRLAMALITEPELLILDEPTNDLDHDSRRWFYSFLRSYQAAVLLISHDREALELMDEIVELSNQGLQNYKGNYSAYLETSQAERTRQQQQLDHAKRLANKRELEREEKLQAKEKRDRQAKKRAPNLGLPKILLGKRKRAAEMTSGKLAVQEKQFVNEARDHAKSAWENQKLNPFVRFDFESGRPHSTKVHFEIEDFNYRFQERETNLWNENISFAVRGSERWWLCGKNGAGKSTLLKFLLHQLPKEAGKAQGHAINYVNALGYLDQKYGGLQPSQSLLENLQGKTRFDSMGLRNELAFFGLTKEKPNQKVETLSGGELLRASLAMALLGPKLPEVLILDEPTNNLDLQSVELLEAALTRFEGALLVVSHDHKFVENLKITHKLDLTFATTPRKI